ncbi:MAG: membrane dipeptidase [Bacteroidales bacterium]|nr:MAG: membrane dipeptidase [Bacteroidales bacterium]
MKKFGFILTLISFGLIISCNNGSKKLTEAELIDHAATLHKEMITIDTHNDTPMRFLRSGFDFSGENNTSRSSCVDLLKMEKGGLDAAFFAVFIGQGECTPEQYEKVNARAIEMLQAIHRQTEQYPNRAGIATTPDDIYRLKKEGKRSIYIGVENGYPIGTDISLLRKYYDLGARYVTLCHTSNNQICTSSTDKDTMNNKGVSDFGREVIKEMNRLGMIIDVSHISDSSFYDVLTLTKTPVIASHSCSRAICNNPRNLSDEMLVKLAENGGVVQMCILSDYVKVTERNPKRDSARIALRKKYNNFQNLTPAQDSLATIDWYKLEEEYPQKRATVADAVDHIDHMVKVMGVDHVGIGTDFDGGGGIDGCKDASQMMNITVELLRRGYSDADIKKIWGENFIRAFRKVQEYSMK